MTHNGKPASGVNGFTKRVLYLDQSVLLEGVRPAEVAAAVGFYDQAHFTRHFKRHTSVPPATFAASHRWHVAQ